MVCHLKSLFESRSVGMERLIHWPNFVKAKGCSQLPSGWLLLNYAGRGIVAMFVCRCRCLGRKPEREDPPF